MMVRIASFCFVPPDCSIAYLVICQVEEEGSNAESGACSLIAEMPATIQKWQAIRGQTGHRQRKKRATSRQTDAEDLEQPLIRNQLSSGRGARGDGRASATVSQGAHAEPDWTRVELPAQMEPVIQDAPPVCSVQ